MIVRKSRKKDGLANIIEGVPLEGVPAILVDDLVNSGDSLLRALEILRAADIRVARIFCVLSFSNPDFLKKFAQFGEGIELSYLLDPSDLGLVVGRKDEDMPAVLFPKRKTLFKSTFFHKTLVVPKSSPAVSGGKAFFAGEHGEVRSVDVATGEEFWKFAIPATPAEKNILSSVVETPDSIVFGAYDGALYALGKTDGEVRFRTSVADWIGSTPAYDPRDGAFFIGLEHFGKMAGSIMRINRDGEPEWNVPLPDFVHSSPIFLSDSDRVICGTNGGELFCLRTSDGFELWKKSFSAPIKAGFCFVPETDSVCFGAFDGNFYCVSAKDGSERWRIRTPHIVYSTPAYRDGSVFF